MIGSAAWGAETPSTTSAAVPDVLEQVVVTAQKREERFQDVPVSISVVDQNQLLDRNIRDVSQLSLAAPSFVSHPGNGGYLTIRGVGTASFARSAEGDVALIIDGVPIPGGANPQDPSELFDVKQVEVLAGPQGTLFGKNAAAGAINIVTNAPDLNAVSTLTHVDYDDRGAVRAQAVLNLPMTGKSALRISGHYGDQGQIYRNQFTHEWNNQLSAGARLRYLYAATDQLQFNLIADYNHEKATGVGWSIIDAPPGSFLATTLAACGITLSRDNSSTCLDARSFTDFENYGGSLQIDYELANGIALTSISSARRTFLANNYDSDSVNINNIFNRNDASQTFDTVTQELRLTSPSRAKLEYVAGLYFYDSSQTAPGNQAGTLNVRPLVARGLMLGNSFDMKGTSRSYAAFGQATFHATDRFSLIAGLRLTSDEVSATNRKFITPGSVGPFNPNLVQIAASSDHKDVSGKLGGQFNLNPVTMLYATATKGYKAPSINDQAPDPSVPLVVRPEIPWNYELGTKLSLLDHRLQVAITAYSMKVDKYQTQILDTNTARAYFGNAESLDVKGVEISAFGPVSPRLTLSLGLNYNDATYGAGTTFGCGPTQTAAQGCLTIARGGTTASVADASGHQAVGQPEWKFTGFGEFHLPLSIGEAFFQGDAVYSDLVSYSPVYDPGNSFGSYWMLGTRLGLRAADKHWSVALFARNLLDKRIPVAVFDTPVAGSLGALGSHAQYLSTDSFRRVGVSVDYRY
jgi:iron complex outermembrane receptor protein